MEIKDLEPKAIWKNFSLLNEIPRPSKKEGKVIAFIKKFGESLGLKTVQDDTGNVIIYKSATPGLENRKGVILQSHVDMVCQKNNDTVFDFETEGIKTAVDGEWVKAKGTTLGADNGIGVATIMSILESKDISHPELEALFTVDEETGMSGAFGLKPGILKGDILINLDTEEDDEIDIGCAGGINVTATGEYPIEKVSGEGVSLEIKGLQGGHSGMDIDQGRGNANVLLARLLFTGLENNIRLLSIDGGGLRNAIPREARAVVAVTTATKYLKILSGLRSDLLNEYKTLEKGLEINVKAVAIHGKVLSVTDSAKLIRSLNAAHNGVFRMSPDVAGLVEASNNIARITLKDGVAEVMCLTRSSVESTKMAVANQLKASFEPAGMAVVFSDSYPGWEPNPNSTIVSVMDKIYREKFGTVPRIIACHAGLECGIIGADYSGMEMVSFGPTIKGAHSPEERVNIKSVAKFWTYLLEILKDIPKK